VDVATKGAGQLELQLVAGGLTPRALADDSEFDGAGAKGGVVRW
jgi:hypothetical protein